MVFRRTLLLAFVILFLTIAVSEKKADAFASLPLSSLLYSSRPASPLLSTPPKSSSSSSTIPPFLDLTGKVAFVAGVSDPSSYGWSIARCLSQCGCTVAVGTWAPFYPYFKESYDRGRFDADRVFDDCGGERMSIDQIIPIDVKYDKEIDIPQSVLASKRYIGLPPFSIESVAQSLQKSYPKGLDYLVHSIANSPSIDEPLLSTSRDAYLQTSSASAFSFVSLLRHLLPSLSLSPAPAALALSYVASRSVIPGYGGGMSSAKAALESDVRVLSHELGRRPGPEAPVRVNAISAKPRLTVAARAIGEKRGGTAFAERARAYGKANAAQKREGGNYCGREDDDVGFAACFLLSDKARGITGQTIFVDDGLSCMGMAREGFDFR